MLEVAHSLCVPHPQAEVQNLVMGAGPTHNLMIPQYQNQYHRNNMLLYANYLHLTT